MARLLLVLAVEIAVSAYASHIVHRGSNGSLDACVGSGCIQGNATPTADTDDANALGIHIIQLRQEVDSGHEVLRIDIG